METHDSPRRRPLHYMREWRLKRGLRQEDLGKAVGTAKSLISRYENGETGMTFDLQLRVMQALNVMPTEFFLPPPDALDDAKRLREREQFFKRKKLEVNGE